jgi:hypothetical protein
MSDSPNRRDFLKTATAGLTAAGVMLSPRVGAHPQMQVQKNSDNRQS